MLYFYLWVALQIVLESFPVSSSSHVRLLEVFFRKFSPLSAALSAGGDYHLFQAYEHVLHLPTLLLVTVFLVSRAKSRVENITLYDVVRCGLGVLCADVITGIFFVALRAGSAQVIPLGIGIVCTGVFLLSLKWCPRGSRVALSWQDYAVLGVAQGIALFPGISRLGATYCAARWRGIQADRAFEVSLLIHLPLIVAASVRAVHTLGLSVVWGQFLNLPVLLVMLGASVSALCGLYFVAACVRTNTLWKFSVYMIIPFMLWVVSCVLQVCA